MWPVIKKTNNLPDNHPHREVIVKPWTNKLMVPRHIVRIDSEDLESTGTHGWQVRYQKPSKFFSDTIGDIRRLPEESLREAITYLAGIYRGPKSQIKVDPAARKVNEIQEVGIRLVRRAKKSRSVAEIYVEASNPEHGKASKRFYVGTENTVTPEKVEAKLIEARTYRKMQIKAHNAKRGVK